MREEDESNIRWGQADTEDIYQKYATLAASHRRLVEAIRADRWVHGDIFKSISATKEFEAAFAEAEGLVGEVE